MSDDRESRRLPLPHVPVTDPAMRASTFRSPRRDEAARLRALMDEIAHRLHDVADAMSPRGFEAMVRELARTKMRWDEQQEQRA